MQRVDCDYNCNKNLKKLKELGKGTDLHVLLANVFDLSSMIWCLKWKCCSTTSNLIGFVLKRKSDESIIQSEASAST